MEKTPARVTFVVTSRANLRWVARSPSTEGRTQRSPNFGKTNIVFQFIFHLIFMLLYLLCRLSMYIVISSRCLQFGLKIEIKRSKFGVVSLKPCILDMSGIDIGHVRYIPLCQAILQNMCIPDTSSIPIGHVRYFCLC